MNVPRQKLTRISEVESRSKLWKRQKTRRFLHKTRAINKSQQLEAYTNDFQRRDKDHHTHVRKGKDNEIDWETEIPVTNPMSNAARDRAGVSPRRKFGKGPGNPRGPPPPHRRKRGDR